MALLEIDIGKEKSFKFLQPSHEKSPLQQEKLSPKHGGELNALRHVFVKVPLVPGLWRWGVALGHIRFMVRVTAASGLGSVRQVAGPHSLAKRHHKPYTPINIHRSRRWYRQWPK
jgi:hypothetical protein